MLSFYVALHSLLDMSYKITPCALKVLANTHQHVINKAIQLLNNKNYHWQQRFVCRCFTIPSLLELEKLQLEQEKSLGPWQRIFDINCS